jgi:hypothetical protein
MPLENSGNMFFMLLGIVRAQTRAKTGDVTWIAPYFPMLQMWADELVLTTEFPANQICTDDFTVHQIIRFICCRYMTEVSTYTASSMLVDTPTISLPHSADTHTHSLSLSLPLSLSLFSVVCRANWPTTRILGAKVSLRSKRSRSSAGVDKPRRCRRS